VVLEQLARENGVLFSDRTRSCIDSSENARTLRVRNADDEEQCVTKFLGAEVTTASFAMYTTSAAVLTQAATLVCFSSFADYGVYSTPVLLNVTNSRLIDSRSLPQKNAPHICIHRRLH
jgi:UMF1 family MFS transporter